MLQKSEPSTPSTPEATGQQPGVLARMSRGLPWLVVILLVFVCSVPAQERAAGERFYQAIRNDDLTMLSRLVRELGVDARDSLGQTPLMLAVAFGSSEAVELLLKAGADAKAATPSGVTALHWSRGDARKVRLLIAHGAEVNARSQLGRTPLIVAASSTGSSEAVRLLLASGAAANAADNSGATPLVEAALADEEQSVALLLERGANVNPEHAGVNRALLIRSPLTAAALNGNAKMARLLLSRGAKVNAISPATNVVKNGPIAFGDVTALHAAAAAASADVARLLLDAGAALDPRDVRGLTPLTFAIATDRPQRDLVRLLIERGADKGLLSNTGETPIDWARKFNNPAILAELKAEPVASAVANHRTVAPDAPRRAVERSLLTLRAVSNRMLATGGCVACHAQPTSAMAVDLARTHGVDIAPPEQESVEIKALTSSGAATFLQGVNAPGLPDGALYNAMTLAALRVPPSVATDALIHVLAAKQRPDGSWGRVGQPRPPMQDGGFSRTALAVRALKVYATPAREAEMTERIERAARWLARTTPLTTEDRVMQLLGLKWAGMHHDVVARRAKDLITLQRHDGGWAQTPHLDSDAYATGQALYTLRELDVPGGVSVAQRGAEYLLRTQREDGSWHVKSRAMKVQPYFESGFPHGHDQWISQAATAWAAMGLTVTALDQPVIRTAGR